jgi:diguanylate cyclase (GGDEF)-like protein
MRDARLDELAFLVRLERDGFVTLPQRQQGVPDGPDKRIAIHLLATGVVNDASTILWPTSSHVVRRSSDFTSVSRENEFRWKVEEEQWKTIASIHAGAEVRVTGTHAAAVRRAELEQSIQRGRIRDPMGILLDGRYAERDLYIALLGATQASPVTVGFLDMNGLKVLNDTHGHEAGDEAIRAFFEVVSSVTFEKGDAHRVGGDEVLVTLPNTSADEGAKLFRLMLRGISERKVREQPLSAVAGLTSSTTPGEAPKDVRRRADEVQYRAKEYSKSRPGVRFGAMALDRVDKIEEF